MENPEENLLATMDDGLEHLLRPETRNYGIVAEGLSADYLRSRHCDLYSVGRLNDRAYAFAFPKNDSQSGE